MQRLGNIDDLEMHRTFNMGVGLVLDWTAGFAGRVGGGDCELPALRVWELGRVDSAMQQECVLWG
jgi:phosphoribosylformylglycinamidine cyclo-ligase